MTAYIVTAYAGHLSVVAMTEGTPSAVKRFLDSRPDDGVTRLVIRAATEAHVRRSLPLYTR